jgi:hypothetical protein
MGGMFRVETFMRPVTELLTAFIFLGVVAAAKAQGNGVSIPNDPYRGFIGRWSGTIPVDPEHMPPTLTVTISEDAGGKRMSWNYVFGRPGEKGYSHATRFVTLKPEEAHMWMHFDKDPDVEYETTGLDEFAKTGLGEFTAVIAYKKRHLFSPAESVANRCVFDLHSNTLTYTWDVTAHGTSRIYSKFDLTRDASTAQSAN